MYASSLDPERPSFQVHFLRGAKWPKINVWCITASIDHACGISTSAFQIGAFTWALIRSCSLSFRRGIYNSIFAPRNASQEKKGIFHRSSQQSVPRFLYLPWRRVHGQASAPRSHLRQWDRQRRITVIKSRRLCRFPTSRCFRLLSCTPSISIRRAILPCRDRIFVKVVVEMIVSN